MLPRRVRWAYRILAHRLPRGLRREHLDLALRRAHIPLRTDVYLSYTALVMAGAFLAGLVLLIALVLLGGLFFVRENPLVVALGLPLPIFLPALVYIAAFVAPELRARSRARDIDAKLPYALNYVTIMANAGVTPKQFFASLAEQPLYGEVANEAAWISRDLELLGRDLLTALNEAIDRSPSVKFQDFLQGIITALASGKNLKDYLVAKSRQFVHDNRQQQKQFHDTVAVLAESYVTVVVAAPLLVIVLLSVMLMMGGSVSKTLLLGYVLVLVLLPMAMAGFAFTIKSVTPEV